MKKFGFWPVLFGVITLLVVVVFFNAGGGDQKMEPLPKAGSVQAGSKGVQDTLTQSAPHPLGRPEPVVNDQVTHSRASQAPSTKEEIFAAIEDAASSYSAEELPKIQPYLLHPDPEVRAAAVQGMINLGDASAAPLLRTAAQLAPSSQEAEGMKKAADYVELPSASLRKRK